MQNDQLTTNEAEPCGHAALVRGALLLQEKWVMMIVFSLMQGPTGFSELMRRGNVNTTTLTQRLNLLEREGLLVKTIHSTMPPRTSYRLTEAGEALAPVFKAIAEWGAKYLAAPAPTDACASGCPSSEGRTSPLCPSEATEEPPRPNSGEPDSDSPRVGG